MAGAGAVQEERLPNQLHALILPLDPLISATFNTVFLQTGLGSSHLVRVAIVAKAACSVLPNLAPGVVARAAEGTSDRGPERGEVSLSLES